MAARGRLNHFISSGLSVCPHTFNVSVYVCVYHSSASIIEGEGEIEKEGERGRELPRARAISRPFNYPSFNITNMLEHTKHMTLITRANDSNLI